MALGCHGEPLVVAEGSPGACSAIAEPPAASAAGRRAPADRPEARRGGGQRLSGAEISPVQTRRSSTQEPASESWAGLGRTHSCDGALSRYDDRTVNEWRCSECGCTVDEALKKRARRAGARLTVRAKVCSPGCRKRRQHRLAHLQLAPEQRQRLERQRRQRLIRHPTIVLRADDPDGELYRLALNVRARRTSAGLTVRALASRADISAGYISLIETAKLRSLPRPRILWALASAFGTTPANLCPRFGSS